MKKVNLLIFFSLAVLISVNSYAVDHSMHGGSSGSNSSSANCIKAKITNFQPEHLATVAPESEFSALVFGVQSGDQIGVTVKSNSITIVTEKKDGFYKVSGKLPAELRDTTARINVKVVTKAEKCNGEDGWLLNIGH